LVRRVREKGKRYRRQKKKKNRKKRIFLEKGVDIERKAWYYIQAVR